MKFHETLLFYEFSIHIFLCSLVVIVYIAFDISNEIFLRVYCMILVIDRI